MFWRRSTRNERYIELGRVPCPRMQSDVELDACFGCKFVEEVRADGHTPFVRCDPPATYLAPKLLS
jgi:hypothetical protein